MAKAVTKQPVKVQSALDLPEKSARLVANHWKLFAFVNLPFIVLGILGIFDGNGNDSANKTASSLDLSEIFKEIGPGLLFLAVFLLICVFFYTMTIKLSLDVSTNKTPTSKSLVDTGSTFWFRLLGLSLLSGLIVVVGAIFLIIPGIIAAVLLTYAPYILIDKDTGITEAIRGSVQMVRANVGPTVGALAVFLGLMILASIIMEITIIGAIIGTIASILFSLILVFRYQELKGSFSPKV